jgi:RNA polymerase-binding transcription factor DksA
MSKLSVAKIEALLRAEKARLDEEHARLAERGGQGRGDRAELADYDVNHPADAGTELFEREKDMALVGNIDGLVVRIEAALAKIHAGTYGICERCGQRIPDARLKAAPYATMCISCQSKYEG